MDAVIELLYRQPYDERVMLSAIGMSEKINDYLPLLSALADSKVKYELSNKSYLRALGICLEWTDLTQWPVSAIETVLVSNFPRWGSLIAKDSLADLLRIVHVMIFRGLSVLSLENDRIPAKVKIDQVRTELLRVLWYSSTLNTLFTLLKTSLEGDSVVNILLRHNSNIDRHMQSVLEAQEVALNCLSALFKLVVSSNQSSFNQLRDILKQTGSDLSDSSSLPFVVSVASFMFGQDKVVVRSETICAAAGCLTGVLQLCELARSVFTSRIGNLHERVLRVAMDTLHEDLINTMMETIPCESKELNDLIHNHQSLYRSVSLLTTQTVSSSEAITSGKAMALLASNDQEAACKFIASSLESVDWLKNEILPSEEQVSTLTSFYALLQARRISWSPFDEPTLSHVLFSFANDSENRREEIALANETISTIASRTDLLQSVYKLLMSVKKIDDNSILMPIYTVLAEASIGSIRETPGIYTLLVSIGIHVFENSVERNGLLVFGKENIEEPKGEILISYFRNVLLFSKNSNHKELIIACSRILPNILLSSKDEPQLLGDIVRYIPVEFALSEPAIMSLIDTLLQRIDTLPANVSEYMTNLFGLFSQTSSVTPKSTIALLSLLASCLVHDPKLGVNASGILASHPVIVAASRAPSWNQQQYSIEHLVWVYTLFVMDVVEGKKEKFLAAFNMTERVATAHTNDLATLEEICLYMRIGGKLNVFQFTSLISSKSPSIFPRSRTEKLAANLGLLDDVLLPSRVPSIFSQRCVWLACDILASSLRMDNNLEEADFFHSLIDCSHFVFQYLRELSGHKKQMVSIIVHDQVEYVPLSIFLHTCPRNQVAVLPTTPRKGAPSSLLHSLPSPHMTPAAPAKNPTLMDSLTPKNSPPKADVASEDIKFQAACPGDCLVRTGLTFIAPSLVSLEDYTGKLVEVLSLCLIQAVRFGKTTQSLLRPLIDLLMTMQSASDKLPSEANELIAEILQQVVSTYNETRVVNHPLGHAALT